jgi:hypothetical protein
MQDEMLTAYVEAALWSTLDYDRTDESGHNPHLDANYSVGDIAPETLSEMRSDCEEFATANAEDLETYYAKLDYGPEQAGHDFWLTRERHGAGFWDRYYGDDEQLRSAVLRLSEAATAYGEFGDQLNAGLAESGAHNG